MFDFIIGILVRSGSMGFLLGAQAALVTLKFLGIAPWPWLWVFSPILLLMLLLGAIALCIIISLSFHQK